MKSTIELITNFYKGKALTEWDDIYNNETLLNITGSDRKEEAHSQFIRYLLDPNSNHDLGTLPLELFLRLLVLKNSNNAVINKYMVELLGKPKNLKVLSCVREKVDRNARYDVFLEIELNGIKANIIIENKITSTENEGQTIKYANYSKKYENPVLVYLSNNDLSTSPDFICISYQDMLDYVFEPLKDYTRNSLTKHILQEYIKTLAHVEIDGRSVTLAMGSEEKELLKKIYRENQELIERLIEAITPSELTKEEAETYKEAIQINKNHRAKWSYNGETMSSKELVLSIVKEQLQKGQSIETMSKFKMHSDPLAVTEERSKEDGYTKQEFNGLIYYVRTCCDLKDVLTLIKALNVDATRLAD